MHTTVPDLRLLGRRSFFLFASVTLVLQFLMPWLPVAHASGTALTFFNSDGRQPLSGIPSQVANVAVRDGIMSGAGADGHLYTSIGSDMPVPSLDHVAKAFVARRVGFVIKDDGTLWSWGDGSRIGRLNDQGTGANEDDPNPGQITSLPPLQDISISPDHVLALDTSGHVWAWGANYVQQLGINTDCPYSTHRPDCDTTTQYVPVQVPGLSNVQSIQAGYGSSLATTANGSPLFWGTVCPVETLWPVYPTPSVYPGLEDAKQVLVDDCSLTYLTNGGEVYTLGFQGIHALPPLRIDLPAITSIATDGWDNRVALSTVGVAYRYSQAYNDSTSSSTPIGNIGLNATYYSLNPFQFMPDGLREQGGVVVANYVPQLPGDTIYYQTENSQGPLLDYTSLDGLTHGSTAIHQTQANLSFDGTRVAYVRNCRIYTANIDGSNEVDVTANHTQPGSSACEQQPVWSSDGAKLAVFYGDESGTAEYAMNANGSGFHLLLTNSADATWSPDGTKLAVDHFMDDGTAQVVIVNVDGTNAMPLPNGGNYYSFPAWSPDGTKIAYEFQANDPEASYIPMSLHVMSTDGTGDTTLFATTDPDSLADITWSPDSSRLAVVYGTNVGASIRVISASGGSFTPVVASANYIGPMRWLHQDITSPTDTTAPILGTPAWSLNPKPTTGTSTLTIPATDDMSGVARAEYFIGDTDPGQGNGATVTLGNVGTGNLSANLTTSFGSNFPTGVYKISVRAQDTAGNWSTPISDYLVVYDPAGPKFTGKRTIAPSLANGDVLPGLIGPSQTDTANFGFSVKYNNQEQINANSDFQFSYTTGTKCNNPAKAANCHSLSLNATSIAWLATQGPNLSMGVFQGTGRLAVDGVTSTITFRVTGQDGTRLNPTANDQLQVQIYNQTDNTKSPAITGDFV
jgi:Tol biopolymer transport system component